ncbi:DUF7059 domain-containing protein [Georgenia halophila]|uniref:DUF7059 domain-containing protein n=1 Tax=Georgenia halophila TaxID=620889 RepID=UPI0031E627AB
MPTPDPELCAALAADLRASGFRSDALREAWGEAADDAIGRGLRRPAERALGERTDALATLGRQLALGVPQPVDAVDDALPRLGARGLAGLGLAKVDRDLVVPLALVRPQSFADGSGDGEWWIASDLDEAALGDALPADHVVGAGGASLTLAGLQLPTPARRVLDLGTGCGIQALRARRDGDAVVATDVSRRALRYADLNALLNDVEGIGTRHGSLFEPVAGETFDRIVSNPPFVITPRADGVPAYEYRDAGLMGDALVEAVVTGVGTHLEPGGVAQLLGNWESREGHDGLDRVREWVESSPVPLDAWVVEREQLNPIEYAELWIRDGGTRPGTPRHAEMLEAWLDDFADRGVTAVGLGYVLLRRADGGPTLSRYERLPQPLGTQSALGTGLAAALAAHDRLTTMDDDALADAVLTVARDVTEARHHMPGTPEPSVIELRQGGGFARTVTADPSLAALVGACDGELAVGQLTVAIAALLDVDAAELRESLLPQVRRLLIDGFLAFADDAPSA